MVKDGNLHHIGFAVTDIQETANLFVKNGYEVGNELYDEELQVKLCYLRKHGSVPLELILQLNPNSLENQLIGKVGVTVYHLCYEVADIDLAYKDLVEQGYLPLFSPISVKALNGSRICYFQHPNLGYIELLEQK